MALKDRRHIIEIPVDKLNSENIDSILDFSNINGFDVDSNAIVLIDEIDKVDLENTNETEPKKIEDLMKTRHKQSILSTLLSKFDGISNYDGIISKLNEFLYRHGRLDPYYFGHMNYNNLTSLICHIYDIDEIPKKYEKIIEGSTNKLTPADVGFYKKGANLDSFMKILKTLN